MKADIEKNGLKISVEGNLKEVKEFMVYFENFEKIKESKKKLCRVTGINLTDELIKSIRKGFFNKPKTFREVSNNFRIKGIEVASSTLHPVLSRLIVKGELNRNKNKEGLWEYGR